MSSARTVRGRYRDPGQIVRRRLEHELLQVPYPAPELLRVQYFMTACAMPQGASV